MLQTFNIINLILYYVIAAFTIVQIFYFVFFFARLIFYKLKPLQQSSKNILPVSIVIAINYYNEHRFVEFIKLLKSNTNTLQKFELVLVLSHDINLHDTNLEALHNIHDQIKIVQLHQESNQIIGAKYAIAIGIKSASYDTILLTRENCLPNSNEWISSMLQNIDKQTEIVLGYFNYKKEQGWFNQFIRYENAHYFMQSFAFAITQTPIMGSGINMIISREAFYKNKGFTSFNNVLGSEDNLLINLMAKKNNIKVELNKKSFTTLLSKMEFAQWSFKKKAHLSTIKYFKPYHKFLLFIYVLSQIAFFATTIAGLILNVIDLPLLSIILLRFFIAYIVIAFTLKRLTQHDLIKWIPCLDLMMIFYYLFYCLFYFKKAKNKK